MLKCCNKLIIHGPIGTGRRLPPGLLPVDDNPHFAADDYPRIHSWATAAALFKQIARNSQKSMLDWVAHAKNTFQCNWALNYTQLTPSSTQINAFYRPESDILNANATKID